jgi:hypothetical protein
MSFIISCTADTEKCRAGAIVRSAGIGGSAESIIIVVISDWRIILAIYQQLECGCLIFGGTK